MSNPHFTTAIAETYRAEMYHEASRRQLAAQARRPSLWSRLIARHLDRQAAPVQPGQVAVASSSVSSS